MLICSLLVCLLFFNAPATTEIYPYVHTLSLHDALPILLFFDGTFWRDDEMLRAGVGGKTGRRMGHMSVSGADGSMAALAPLALERKVYIHIDRKSTRLNSSH